MAISKSLGPRRNGAAAVDRQSRIRALGMVVVAVLWLAAGAATIGAAAQEAKPQETAREGASLRADGPASVTRHALTIEGRRIEYRATAGTVDVTAEGTEAKGRIFFVEYALEGADPEQRPLTFVFNGGPGAASAYLHLLALGPRIVALEDDGTLPPPPVRMVDNPATWLAFTDLVFVDPVGTGFSRAVAPGDPENDGGEADDSSFWRLERDLDAVAEFIRLHLTRAERWPSPKFLAGESYGGYRAAALPTRLASEPGVRLNGIVLVSPVLEFSLIHFDDFRLMPWVSLFPSYAATAHFHGESAVPGPLEDVLAKAEVFATGAYLAWLAGASTAETDDTLAAAAGLLGLAPELVARYRGRIPREVFAKNLLREERRLVSLYDGTVTTIDPHPASPNLRGKDPILEGLVAPLTAAFNVYIREHLQFETERPYRVLNQTVGRHWDWAAKGRSGRYPLGTAEDLKEAMSLNADLLVFIAHGVYDMVTPYIASRFAVRQMALDPALAGNVTFEVYPSGHMPYTHPATRAGFARDARAFFARGSPGAGTQATPAP